MIGINILVCLLLYPGFIIFLIKNYDKEKKRSSVLSSDKTEVYEEYKKYLQGKELKKPLRSLLLGIASFIIGIILIISTFIRHSIFINDLNKSQMNEHYFMSSAIDSSNYLNHIMFGIILAMGGVSLIVFYLIVHKEFERNEFI